MNKTIILLLGMIGMISLVVATILLNYYVIWDGIVLTYRNEKLSRATKIFMILAISTGLIAMDLSMILAMRLMYKFIVRKVEKYSIESRTIENNIIKNLTDGNEQSSDISSISVDETEK